MSKKLNELLPEGIKVQIVNPQGILLLGRSKQFDEEQQKDFELIKRQYKHVADIMTYHIKPKTEREWSLIPNLLPIYYGDKRPLMITRMLDEALEYVVRPETLQDLINQEAESLYISLNTKTLQWIGEEEWRFGIPKNQAESNVVPFDFAESLYLGENIEEEWKEKLLEIAKEQGLLAYQRKLDSTKSKWIYEKFY